MHGHFPRHGRPGDGRSASASLRASPVSSPPVSPLRHALVLASVAALGVQVVLLTHRGPEEERRPGRLCLEFAGLALE